MPTLPERIEIVWLVAKFNSPNQVICELKKKSGDYHRYLRVQLYMPSTRSLEKRAAYWIRKSVDVNHWIQRNHRKSSHSSRKTHLRL